MWSLRQMTWRASTPRRWPQELLGGQDCRPVVPAHRGRYCPGAATDPRNTDQSDRGAPNPPVVHYAGRADVYQEDACRPAPPSPYQRPCPQQRRRRRHRSGGVQGRRVTGFSWFNPRAIESFCIEIFETFLWYLYQCIWFMHLSHLIHSLLLRMYSTILLLAQLFTQRCKYLSVSHFSLSQNL